MEKDIPKPETGKSASEPVHIYRANNEGEYGRVAAILSGADIRFFPKTTGLQPGLGVGVSGMGTGGHSGPIDILVGGGDQEKALALIEADEPWRESTDEDGPRT